MKTKALTPYLAQNTAQHGLKYWTRWIPAVGMLVVIALIAEVCVRSGLVADYLMPAPSQVFTALVTEDAGFTQAFFETFSSALLGFLLSILIGTSLALIMSLSPFLERAFLPLSVFFQTVPIIAIAPLLVIWFGFGGPTVRASAFVVSLFPILANTLAGLTQTPATRLELFRALRASRFQTLLRLRIPQALPQFFTGLEVAAGLAVIGAIVGEFVAGSGLGSVIDSARTQQRVDLVFAAVILSTALGIVLVATVQLLRQILFRIRPFDVSPED